MIEELRTLVLFAEEGSIQRVALRLPLTQPAVTRQIQRLEDMLGTTLLDRRQKPPRLTQAGLEVLARGRNILASVEALKSFAAEAEPAGLLRLGLAHGLSDRYMAQAIAGAVAAFPKVSLRLKTGWSAELTEQFERGDIDVAIVLRPSDGPDPAALGTEKLGVIASATICDRQPDRRIPMPWVLSPAPCDARRKLMSVLAGTTRYFEIAAEIQDPAMQVEWVRRGHGFGLMPLRLARRGLPEDLTLVDMGDVDLSLEVVAFRSPHLNRLSGVANAVVEAVRKIMATEA